MQKFNCEPNQAPFAIDYIMAMFISRDVINCGFAVKTIHWIQIVVCSNLAKDHDFF